MFRNVVIPAMLVAGAGGLAASSSSAPRAMAPVTIANNLTFASPVALPGVTLRAGTYVFESGPGGTNPNIVRVVSENRQKLYFLGFTVPIEGPKGVAPSILTFGEAAKGVATPILAWYPIGSSSGHQFMYR